METYTRLSKNTPWEKGRVDSRWHFDYTVSERNFINVCNFDADFSDAISEAMVGGYCSNYTGKNFTGDVKKDWKQFTSTEIDLVSVKGNPYLEHFHRYNAQGIGLFEKIAEELGMIHCIIAFNMQKPGQTTPNHFDRFGPALAERMPEAYAGIDFINDSDRIRRVVVMLDDWKLGQFFQIGNSTWHQWKKGDCITWDWRDMPHCTGNVGFWERPMLQITGMVTDKTKDLLNRASSDLVISI